MEGPVPTSEYLEVELVIKRLSEKEIASAQCEPVEIMLHDTAKLKLGSLPNAIQKALRSSGIKSDKPKLPTAFK